MDGLSSGLVYGVLALALSVVFQGTGMLNFAQGEMATLSAYGTFALLGVGLTFWVALAITVLLSAAGGGLIERVLFRRLEPAGELALLTASVALLLGLNALMAINPQVRPTRLQPGQTLNIPAS